jgi:hypothetical protein
VTENANHIGLFYVGKTNVACLTMLNILAQYRKERPVELHTDGQDDGDEKESFDMNSFKIVYVAPMKALVQEVVKNFSQRLAGYGVVVKELSGDSSLTRQQIAETQLLVVSILGVAFVWSLVIRHAMAYFHLLFPLFRPHQRNGTL